MARPWKNNPEWKQKSPAKTPEVIAKIIEGHRMDFWTQDTCVYAGISDTTYYRRVEDDEKLRGEIEAAKRFAFLIAKRTVIKGIKDNPQLALQRLKLREKNVYSERTELTGAEGGAITYEALEKMSDDELLKLSKGEDKRKWDVVIIKK